MNELNETLVDIAKTASPTKPEMTELRQTVLDVVDFRKYVEEAPCLMVLEFDAQMAVVLAAFRDLSYDDYETFLSETLKLFRLKKAHFYDVIRRRNSLEEMQVDIVFDPAFSSVVSTFRAMAHMYFEDEIDRVITEEYGWFCREHGIYASDSDSGPGELLGFKDD